MKPVFKIILGFLILLLAVIVTLGVLFTDLTEKSFYSESGTIKTKGISDSITIYKDNFGVPHISAKNESDLYFALGYVHAQDRLWQMDIARRVAEGKLSEILGRDVLQYDVLFRTLGIYKTAYVLYENLPAESKVILDDYSRGVNNFIENHISKLPLEFDVLNYKPDYWKPEHSLMVIRLMGWELNLSWFADYTMGEIVNRYGIEIAREFYPDYPEDGPFIIKPGDGQGNPDSLSPPGVSSKNPDLEKKDISSLKGLFDTVKEFRKFYGTEGTHVGSNSWVVNGKKSETGKPILANDTHLSLNVPCKWYEASLYNESTGNSVKGFTLPGGPEVVIGSNNSISWGITNLMADNSDFYIFDLDKTNKQQYIYEGTVHALDSTVEAVKIKDEADEFIFTSYNTKAGPVVSGLEKTGFINEMGIRKEENRIIVFRWTGYEMSDEVGAIHKVNTAHNWTEFTDALKTFGIPALNFIYSDTAGNIGYKAAGLVPIRDNTFSEFEYSFPSLNEIKWNSFIPYNELPSIYNPEDGYIVTANNKPAKDYKYYITNLYEPEYRAKRIEEILKSRNNFSPEEFKLIQNDITSVQAREFCKYIFDAFSDSTGISMEYVQYLKVLKDWNYEMLASSPAGLIFAQFEIELYRNLYMTSLGEELFDDYMYIKSIPVRNTSKLLRQNNSVLFKPESGQGKAGTRDEIVRKSFYDAINVLRVRAGENDMNNWAWGLSHEVLMKHPLGVVPALSSILNIGPYELGGNGTTVNSTEYNFNVSLKTGRFQCYLGAAMRMIVDLSNIEDSYTIITTGQSGQPLHPNFRNQARLWLNGEYKTVNSSTKEIDMQSMSSLLILEAE